MKTAMRKTNATDKDELRHDSDTFYRSLAVDHSYTDFALATVEEASGIGGALALLHSLPPGSGSGFSAPTSFPAKLYNLLDNVESTRLDLGITWAPHGRSFRVTRKDFFVQNVLNRYFSQNKYSSFQRQLNIYGFRRLTSGSDQGGYYNPFFLRGRPDLIQVLKRQNLKGHGPRKPSNPEDEPNLYKYPYMPTKQSSTNRAAKQAPKQHSSVVQSTSQPGNSVPADRTVPSKLQEELLFSNGMDDHRIRQLLSPSGSSSASLSQLKNYHAGHLQSNVDARRVGNYVDTATDNRYATLNSFSNTLFNIPATTVSSLFASLGGTQEQLVPGRSNSNAAPLPSARPHPGPMPAHIYSAGGSPSRSLVSTTAGRSPFEALLAQAYLLRQQR